MSKKTDLAFMWDSTGSMGEFVSSAGQSIPEVLKVMEMTERFGNILASAYEDYGDGPNLWRHTDWQTGSTSKLLTFVTSLRAGGGDDTAEATKTALNEFLRLIKGPTVLIIYTDAPPHTETNKNSNQRCKNNEKEVIMHKNKQWPYDWVAICNKLRENNVTVYTIMNKQNDTHSSFYVMLAELTGGQVLRVSDTKKSIIAQVTISLLMGIMGQETNFATTTMAFELKYIKPFDITTVKSEINHGGYLDDPSLLKTEVVKIRPIETLNTDLRSLTRKFAEDETYRNLVFNAFMDLMKPTTIVSLTTNPIFGQLWRGICNRRNDERREQLINKLDNTLRTASLEDQKIVREWLASSYNQLIDIRDEIFSVKAQVPALILEKPCSYEIKEILEIGRTCNPAILRKVSDLMTGLRVVTDIADLPKVDKENEAGPVPYIPLGLQDGRVFSLLPNLMAPGTQFSLRPAVVITMIAVLTNNILLKERAERFLDTVKGKWFDPEVPENFTFEFLKLALRVPLALTPSEITMFTKLRDFCGLMINGKTNIKIVHPKIPTKSVGPDHKVKCSKCDQYRSFTLMTETGVCGLCFYDVGHKYPEYHDKNTSTWLECRICHANYALIVKENLNVEPKCHYCRMSKKAPTVTCFKCENKFVDPMKMQQTPYACAQCETDHTKSVEDVDVPFEALFDQNRSLILANVGLSLPNSMNPFSGHSLYKQKDSIKESTKKSGGKLIHNGKPVLNSDDVLKQIVTWIESGGAERGYCMLCFDDFNKKTLISACGHKRCHTVACSNCMAGWYGVPKPGQIIFASNLSCPFCKMSPNGKIFGKFNHDALALMSTNQAMDPAWYYGWCLSCYKPKQAVEHLCAQEGVPNITGFICSDCQKAPDESKPCPGCGIATVKSSGCNHITCPVPACSSHWCYQCSARFNTSGEVYAHMHKEHGGYGFNWFVGHEDEDEDDDHNDDDDYDDDY